MISRIFKTFMVLCLISVSAISIVSCKKKSLGDLTVMKEEILIEDPDAKEVKQVENGSLSRGTLLTYFSEKEVNKVKYYEVATEKGLEGWIPVSSAEKGKLSFLTILSDVSLIEDPGAKSVKYVSNSRVKRGEYLTILEEKTFNGIKYYNAKIDLVTTKGWISEKNVKPGVLKSVTVQSDADLYSRPSEKSDKIGTVKSGQVAFLLEENGDFALIQYPWREAYVKKSVLGNSGFIVKNVSIPGIGTVTVTSSSQLVSTEGGEMAFDPRNAFDGSLQTAWSEGKTDGPGIGESISVNLPQYMRITSVSIVNGSTKNEESYKNNSRVAKLKISTNEGKEVVIDLEDGVMDFQTRDIDLTGNSVNFQISDVYKGDKYSDTCISEIKIEAKAEEVPVEPAPVGDEGE
ncbi:MAG: discoidin domain-containing protein [Spirochaetes bacterium]|nr:discoidin domain-containing protein [Spirochaetota bacterium]